LDNCLDLVHVLIFKANTQEKPGEGKSYSDLRDFTGFVVAALIDSKLTVSQAMPSAMWGTKIRGICVLPPSPRRPKERGCFLPSADFVGAKNYFTYI
jgi:hypothetical protein